MTVDWSVVVIDLWRDFLGASGLPCAATYRGVHRVLPQQQSHLRVIDRLLLAAVDLSVLLLVFSVLSRLAVTRAGDEQAVISLVARGLPSNFDFLSTQVSNLQRAPIELEHRGARSSPCGPRWACSAPSRPQ
jgi:hypothetical protein